MFFSSQDDGAPFTLEYAWWLLKDEPKWVGGSTATSLKKNKDFY